jgi:tRNA (guanine-N7-)-methyltransferase
MTEESRNYPNKNEERLIRSFGRIKSRKFSDHKNFLLQNLLPLYQFFPDQKNFDLTKENFLEIGFGFGDFLFEKAKKNPDILFFASEPHLNGVVNLLSKLEKEPLKNLKISTQDIRTLFDHFPDKFFDEVFILFPDPWPKAKHFKRRLISQEFLDKILSVKIKTSGKLTIATDHDSYKTWILSVILRSKNFSWLATSKKDWQNFPDDWVTTKYQRKALNEGRMPIILNLICSHE